MSELTILVVDDSPSMRRSLVVALLRIDGVACIEAADGVEAVRRLVEGRFDAVICDINMPVMDGLKVISHMRRTPEHSDVPVVVVTTESGAEDRERAMALGADRYLTKPLQAHSVVHAVKELLQIA